MRNQSIRCPKISQLLAALLVMLFGLLTAAPAAHADADWEKAIIGAFEGLGSDLTTLEKKTKGESSTPWYNKSVLDVAAVGAGACAIPGVGMAALIAEFPYLMRELYNSAMGLGFIVAKQADKDDFAKYWRSGLANSSLTLAPFSMSKTSLLRQ